MKSASTGERTSKEKSPGAQPNRALRDLLLGFDSVVIISPFAWSSRDGLPGSTHHIAREFARALPTVFVEPPIAWDPRSEHWRAAGFWSATVGAQAHSPAPTLVIFHRRSLPLGRLPVLRNLDLVRNIRALRRLLHDRGFRRPLVWHSFPYDSERLLEAIDSKCLVYHCLDRTAQVQEEARIVKRADAVFCVSETLVAKHKLLNPQTYLLPNGIDLGVFDRDRATRSRRPADLPASGRVIGFVGQINYHLDIELLLEVAEHYSDATLMVIGKLSTRETAPTPRQLDALDRLRRRDNVRLVGFKRPGTLPAYIHAFDVCLIPFLEDPYNQERDPLKFYEYASLGKPIITTDVPVAWRYPNLCYRASTHAHFIELISRAFEESRSAEHERARLALVRSHGWASLLTNACQSLRQPRMPHGVHRTGPLANRIPEQRAE
jgi:glycosyltransferase involved in cell wall biosynthesis